MALIGPRATRGDTLQEERPGPRRLVGGVRPSSFTRLEEDLLRIPGVVGARLTGEDEVTEVHIVASNGRNPKQIVRDVQSLAAAGFGITLDHRVVSVVQLEDTGQARRTETPGRPLIEMILTGAEDGRSWTRIRLRWANGEATEGQADLGDTPRARARGGVSAAIQALGPVLRQLGARLDVEDVLVQPLGAGSSVIVRATYRHGSTATEVVGSSIVRDDVAGAAVRALLHAVNRKLF